MKGFYLIFLWMILLPATLWAQSRDDSSGVVVHTDPRLAILFANKPERGYQGMRGSIHSARGYRVQIYNGRDRNLAQQYKVEFIRMHPGVATYLSYIAPTYRLKVGNFKSREEAVKLYRQLSERYSPCMIVPDIIVINTLRNEH
ncbi:MAG: SPOR domain-containing protein [Bacteroidetes bacterium]|nr:SPOR domain-containing protein [Bacteroidota bacterium]MBS1630227.1 SPOR domain-containing protein [Bacteroidota bacterium]